MNKDKKHQNIIVVFGIALSLIFFGAGMLGERMFINKNNKNTECDINDNLKNNFLKENIQKYDLTEVEARAYLNLIDKNAYSAAGLLGLDYHHKTKIKVNDLTMSDKVKIAALNTKATIDNIEGKEINYVLENDLIKSYEKLFGLAIPYQNDNPKIGCDDKMTYFNADKKRYEYDLSCVTNDSRNIKVDILTATKDNEKIMITTRVLYTDIDSKNKKTIIYSDYDQNNKIDEFDVDKSWQSINTGLYKDKLNTYRFIFNKINNDYYFNSVEKI